MNKINENTAILVEDVTEEDDVLSNYTSEQNYNEIPRKNN